MKEYVVEVHGGQKADSKKPGKLTWPASINVRMGRFHAWELAESLLRQLRENEADVIQYPFCGTVEEIEDKPKR